MRRGEHTVIGSSERALRRAGVTLRPRFVGAERDRVRFADGSTRTVSAVGWATGFRADHSWIRIPGVLDEDGALRHSQGVTPSPGLFVLGQRWQRTSGSALLGYVGFDAGQLGLPMRQGRMAV